MNIDSETKQILEKYRKKLLEELDGKGAVEYSDTRSRQYKEFRSSMLPSHYSLYEKACNFSEKVFKISPDKKSLLALQDAIASSHLNVTPAGVSSFAILGPLSFILFAVLIASGLPYMLGVEPSMFVTVFCVFIGLALMIPLQKMPYMLANSWRLKASGEMILAVFYVVTYMRHTSNLELALEFAANRLGGPLSLDLRKVLWDIEIGKYSTLKESLDAYLETWRKDNLEFIESMHLAEASLYEASNDRRLAVLDKALDVMLEETYEKMLHYAHNLNSPMNTLNMLGFVLPILGLVILPLIVNFMADTMKVEWYHLMLIYNVAIPLTVFYLGKSMLAARPTGYGDTDISDVNPSLKKYKNFIIKFFGKEISIKPLYLAIITFAVIFLIGMSPVLVNFVTGAKNVGVGERTSECGPPSCPENQFCLLEYRDDGGKLAGPYDTFSSAISVLVPIAFGLAIGMYYKIRTSKLIKLREESKALEKEFSSAMFQLGNRLADGIPAEIAFSKVAAVMHDSKSGEFFQEVNQNLNRRGLGLQDALFNEKTGAVNKFPSGIIASSMKIMVEAVQKSPLIAAQALISISQYIKQMHRIDERLKDLLADVIASMKSQGSFLAPVISAIVIGIASMMTNVLSNIQVAFATQSAGMEGIPDSIPEMFGGAGVPTFYFQIVVGLYVMQLIFILTILVNGVENGSDKLKEEHLLGQNMTRGAIIYGTLAFIVIVSFNMLASFVTSRLLTC